MTGCAPAGRLRQQPSCACPQAERTRLPSHRRRSCTGSVSANLEATRQVGVLLPGSQKLSRYTIGGGDLAALSARLADMRKKAAAVGGRPVRILSCYEPGLDGPWLPRWMTGRS